MGKKREVRQALNIDCTTEKIVMVGEKALTHVPSFCSYGNNNNYSTILYEHVLLQKL